MTVQETKEFAKNIEEKLKSLPALMPPDTDIIKLYNPANAASLTAEQLADMQKLTSEQIKQLAIAYPNLTMQRAYLLFIDNRLPVHKQLPSLGSFENLWNVREKNGQRWWVPFNFVGAYKPKHVSTVKPRRSEVLDLSNTELMSLPGFKTSANGTVKATEEMVQVTKVVKEVVKPKSETMNNPTIKSI